MEYTIKDYIEKYWQGIEANTPEYTFAKINEKDYCEAFGFDWNDWISHNIERINERKD